MKKSAPLAGWVRGTFGPRLRQLDGGAHPRDVLDLLLEGRLELLHAADGVGEQLGDHLDVHGHEVHAADDEHVVAPTRDPAHSTDRPPARAQLRIDGRDVPRPVADHRHRPLRERGEDQFALGTIGERLARRRVDDLRVEVVLEDVRTILVLALGRDAGPDDLGQTVDVVRAGVRAQRRSAETIRPRAAGRGCRGRPMLQPSPSSRPTAFPPASARCRMH